jgi:hypothetical protein
MKNDKYRCNEWKRIMRSAANRWNKKIENKRENLKIVFRELAILLGDSKAAPPECVLDLWNRMNAYFQDGINLGDGTIAAAIDTLTDDQINSLIDIVNEMEDLSDDDDDE